MKHARPRALAAVVAGLLAAAGFSTAAFAEESPASAPPADDRSTDLYQTPRFRIHQPNYLLFGFPLPALDTQPLKNQAKFRISIEYLIAGRTGGPGLFIAYTQVSFWNIYDTSQPLYDNNYQPEAFLTLPDFGPLDEFSFGVRHHSNGLAFFDSRSYQRTFVRGLHRIGGNDGHIAVEAWAPWDKPDNPDIADFAGYGQVELYWRPASGANWKFPARHGALSVRIPFAARTFFPSLEAMWSFRVGRWDEGRLAPRLAVQYFEGYAQNLLDYRERSSSWRIGLVIGE